MALPTSENVHVLIREAYQYRRAVVGVFVGINLVMLLLGLVWPKGYTSSTAILVDEKNILQPLMQGAAVATEVSDRSKLAREVIYGRKMMLQVLEVGGWRDPDMTPAEQERLIDRIQKRIAVTSSGKNIIRISFRDDDAERSFRVTKALADLFISESFGAKASESQAAFDFIDKQTQEYHEKLLKAEEALKEFRSANLDAQPGTDGDIATRLSALQTRIEQGSQELREAEIKKQSLEKQLSGEAEVSAVLSREGQYRTRIADLQSQLETLRLSYHDDYPDIVRIRHQIADLNDEIAKERQRRENAKSGGRVVIDDNVINNPMYQELKRELSQTQILVDTLKARIGEARYQLQQAIDRGKRVHGGEATLAELTRDYQVNRELYQDLLKRRESARVSVNLDRERQGLTFKVQEPAIIPQTPSGLRYLHFVVGGLLLGVLVPVGLIYLQLRADPRVRVREAIAIGHKVPVVAVLPHLETPAERGMVAREMEGLALAVSATLGLVVIVSVLRALQVV